MFKSASYLCSCFVGFIAIFWILHLCLIKSSDIEKYKKFKKQKEKNTTQSIGDGTYQTREQVQKDIWFTDDQACRLHYRIDSYSSTLSLVPIGHKVEVIENLQTLKGWMQEKIYQPANGGFMQQMRYFEANEGTYQYSLQKFLANKVALSLFRLPGIELNISAQPSLAFLRGIAEDVCFSLSGKNPQFQAHQFKALLKQDQEAKP